MEGIIALLIKYKYLIMFGLMFAEWPAVSFVCAFMAAQGFFSFGIVYILSIMGDLVGDVIWYSVGRLARRLGATELLEKEKQWIIIDKKNLPWKSRFSLRVANKIYKLEKKSLFGYIYAQMEKRFFLSLFIIKITPPLSIAGQISFGFFKVKFRRFFRQTALLCLLFESIFLNLWYFSSMSINTFKDRLDIIGMIISIVVIGWLALRVAFLIMKKISSLGKTQKDLSE